MNHGSIDTALVHQRNGFLGREVRNLPMRQIARQAAPPQVDLGVNYLHRIHSKRAAGRSINPAAP
jgi:hypothetical protein